MILSTPWEPLPARNGFLVQYISTSSGYAIRATDFAQYWTEDLNEQSLVDRAEELECPIDASVDAKVLTGKLRGILFSSDAQLVIADTFELTGTLKIGSVSLQWSFRLSSDDSQLPLVSLSLLQATLYYHSLTQQLLDTIKEKDQCINRVLDFCRSSSVTYTPSRRYAGFDEFKLVRPQLGATSKDYIIESLGRLRSDDRYRKDMETALSSCRAMGSKQKIGGLVTKIGGSSTKKNPQLHSMIRKTRHSPNKEPVPAWKLKDQRMDSIESDLSDTASEPDTPTKTPSETPSKLISLISPRKRKEKQELSEPVNQESEEDEATMRRKKALQRRADLNKIAQSSPVKKVRKF